MIEETLSSWITQSWFGSQKPFDWAGHFSQLDLITLFLLNLRVLNYHMQAAPKILSSIKIIISKQRLGDNLLLLLRWERFIIKFFENNEIGAELSITSSGTIFDVRVRFIFIALRKWFFDLVAKIDRKRHEHKFGKNNI